MEGICCHCVTLALKNHFLHITQRRVSCWYTEYARIYQKLVISGGGEEFKATGFCLVLKTREAASILILCSMLCHGMTWCLVWKIPWFPLVIFSTVCWMGGFVPVWLLSSSNQTHCPLMHWFTVRNWQTSCRRTNSQFFTLQLGNGADRCADMPVIAAGLFWLLKASTVKMGRLGEHDTKVKWRLNGSTSKWEICTEK